MSETQRTTSRKRPWVGLESGLQQLWYALTGEPQGQSI